MHKLCSFNLSTMKTSFKLKLIIICLSLSFFSFSQTENKLTLPDLSDAYTTADILPSFYGGKIELSKYLSKNIKYPVKAMENNESGKVTVRFVVEKNGKISRAHVIKSASELLDNEAIRVVNSMPAWVPGEVDGKKVAVIQVLPFTFNSQIGKEPVKYPGGADSARIFIEKNLKYPEIALKNNIEGTVEIGLTVDKNGLITKTWVKNSDNTHLNDEALRLVNLIPTLIPGTYKNEPIEMDAVFNIVFSLPDSLQNDSENDKIFEVVEVSPMFNGGDNALMKYLSKSINYPIHALKNKIQGKVLIQFVVWKDGSIKNVKVIRGVDEYLDKEALRVISAMPNWIPGKQGGKPVNCRFFIPVYFRTN